MINITALHPQQIYSIGLSDGGAIVGTLIFPASGASGKSLGGYSITHARAEPTVRNGNLHLFTLDVGVGVYEILIPLEQIRSAYPLGAIDEPIINSPEEILWQKLGPSLTWNLPFERMLVDMSIKFIKERHLRFRPVVELPDVQTFPHPVTFPRYAPFKPLNPLVIYLDYEVMSRHFYHFEHEKSLFQIFKDHPALHLSQDSKLETGSLVFLEGAIGFFSPPQMLTWEGQSVELVAITSKPFFEGTLGEDWILGFVRNICFPFFREGVERLTCTYSMCGEWFEIGLFESEYGSRRHALRLGASVYYSEAAQFKADSPLVPIYGKVDRPGSQMLIDETQKGTRNVISILFLAADPSDGSRLRLGEEFREIQEKLQLAKLREQFELHERMSVRPADISQALLDVQPRIVHFSGHGTSSGALWFENQIGDAHAIQPDALASLFEQFSHHINCVLLNACYAEKQAKAIAKHIDYVIGMKKGIGDKAAIAFSIGFYQALGAGRVIEEAYKLGCIQIRLQGIPEHLTPILIKKAQIKR